MSEIIKLFNGLKVKWGDQRNVFENSHLEVEATTSEKVYCRNPWNNMSESESKKVKHLRPIPIRNVCALSSLLKTTAVSLEDLEDEITDLISADCWGVFVTNSDRSQIVKSYFDHRAQPKFDHEQDIRTILCENPTILIGHIETGDTVVIVLGGTEFKEFYMSKVENIYLLQEVDHSISW